MTKSIEFFYSDFRDFISSAASLCCDTPIKYRQVFVPMMTGLMDRSIGVLSILRRDQASLENHLGSLKQCLVEWQIVLEMLLDLKAVKDVRIGPLLEKSEVLRKHSDEIYRNASY